MHSVDSMPPTSYMYNDPPSVLICLWGGGTFCATLTLVITAYNLRNHFQSAREQGLGHHEMLPSLGARADRVMQLLMVPLVGAATAALQMFFPGAEPILSLLRVWQFSTATRDLVEFLFLLNGSQQHIIDHLPKEKITLFASAPLCCIFGWPCCAQRPRLGHLRFFVAGVRQFGIIIPLIGVMNVYFQARDLESDDGLQGTLQTIITLSTFFGMWSFKSLLALITETIPEDEIDPRRISLMEKFVLLQMVFAKLLGVIVRLLISTDGLHSSSWVMPKKVFMTIATGFLLTVVQLVMAIVGACAYNADDNLYPELDEAHDVPPDCIAILDMNGVDVTRWKRLEALHDRF